MGLLYFCTSKVTGGEMSMKKLSDYGELLTVKELCEYLNICRVNAYKFLDEHNVAYTKIGKGFKISRQSLAEVLHIEIQTGVD